MLVQVLLLEALTPLTTPAVRHHLLRPDLQVMLGLLRKKVRFFLPTVNLIVKAIPRRAVHIQRVLSLW